MNAMLADPVTYTKVDNLDILKAKREVSQVIEKAFQSKLIHQKQKSFLTRCTPKLPNLYGLPKIHKEN